MYYRLQYRNGSLSCWITEPDQCVGFARVMDVTPGYGVVAVFKIKVK